MAISPVALKTYASVADIGRELGGDAARKAAAEQGKSSFTDQLRDSLSKVNEMQQQKDAMITSFASGENQNVHELMISLQKAGMAMSLTSAVRNKVLEAYRELMKMPF
jgi:flagellar hook-basal body complex protein FliE